ncbi:hypothetical protein [Blastopirellula marina]|uniref:Uncharacterized protein n=1 Tax=Blastopirellula marina DSM 3645 TaxID=314230 RepID=A3ZM48_9BACT|nr:hypothetical protein [Blastopirellula marina]EAQ82831.1 hypothetical protein DSM3645_10537 [Blastopirellula marina DSM 3645]
MHSRLEQIARHAIAPAVLIALFLLVSCLIDLLTFTNTHAIFFWLHNTGEFGSAPHSHRLALPLWCFPLAILAILALLTFVSYGLLRRRAPPKSDAFTESSRTEEKEALK